jgi:hypothetical protein
MCDLACISGIAVVSAITLALILNREGLLCFDSSGLSKHRSRRPHRAQD